MQTFIKYIIRLITAPFLKLSRVIKKQGNINSIMRKMTKPMIAAIQNIFKFKPEKWQDYITVGNWLVAKKVVLLIVLVICAVPIIYFTQFAADSSSIETLKKQEEKTFQYDDIKLPEYTGKAIIKAGNQKMVYKGDIVLGICTGEGQVYNLQGELVYEGEIKENIYSGKGKQYDEEGQLVYEGEFSNNKYNGTGILYDYKTKRRYEGDFVESIKEGKGKVYNAKNQVVYEGEFGKNLYQGIGALHNETTGEWYAGAFEGGKKQGAGILYNDKNEVIFEGTYTRDFFDGEAMRYWKNKLMYVGPYKVGKREAMGKEYNTTGRLLYEGDLVLGKRHGQGTQYDGVNNRKIYEGGFFEGKWHGDGVLYDIAGKEIFSGKFFNDDIDYSVYLEENLQVIETAFKETPKLIYKGEKGYYIYPELGIILVANLDSATLSTILMESNGENKQSQGGITVAQKIKLDETQPEEVKEDKTKTIVEAVIVLKDLEKLPEGLKLEDDEEQILEAEDYLSMYSLQQENEKLLNNITIELQTRGPNIQELLSEVGKVNLYRRRYTNDKLQYEMVYRDKKDTHVLYYKMILKKG